MLSVHSNSSNIAEKIKRKRIFWIINLIKIVKVAIISKSNSFIILVPCADPLMYAKNDKSKSRNKFTGIVNTKTLIKSKDAKAQIKNLPCIIKKKNEQKINKNKVKANSTIKKKISSALSISFSFSFNIKNLVNLLVSTNCLL
jgi:hypothetical protein